MLHKVSFDFNVIFISVRPDCRFIDISFAKYIYIYMLRDTSGFHFVNTKASLSSVLLPLCFICIIVLLKVFHRYDKNKDFYHYSHEACSPGLFNLTLI